MRPLIPTAIIALAALAALASPLPIMAQGYFVTYSHHMEEPGNLELATKSLFASPKQANSFLAHQLELEYGVKTWWTSELYLNGQSTFNESTVFTGYKLENRFRPLLGEHRINPVLYFEFSNTNSADKSLREIVGHDSRFDLQGRNNRNEREKEVELKLILSSNARGWNFSENFITEKNVSAGQPWEYGYAFAIARPLALKASSRACTFCRENFSAGAELYGGLGDHESFGLRDTSHYIGPLVSLRTPSGPTFSLSPTFGLNSNSNGFMLRFGMSYEIEQFASRFRRER